MRQCVNDTLLLTFLHCQRHFTDFTTAFPTAFPTDFTADFTADFTTDFTTWQIAQRYSSQSVLGLKLLVIE